MTDRINNEEFYDRIHSTLRCYSEAVDSIYGRLINDQHVCAGYELRRLGENLEMTMKQVLEGPPLTIESSVKEIISKRKRKVKK